MSDKAIEAAISTACKYIKVDSSKGHPQVTLENISHVVKEAIKAYEATKPKKSPVVVFDRELSGSETQIVKEILLKMTEVELVYDGESDELFRTKSENTTFVVKKVNSKLEIISSTPQDKEEG